MTEPQISMEFWEYRGQLLFSPVKLQEFFQPSREIWCPDDEEQCIRNVSRRTPGISSWGQPHRASEGSAQRGRWWGQRVTEQQISACTGNWRTGRTENIQQTPVWKARWLEVGSRSRWWCSSGFLTGTDCNQMPGISWPFTPPTPDTMLAH